MSLHCDPIHKKQTPRDAILDPGRNRQLAAGSPIYRFMRYRIVSAHSF